MMLLLGVQQNTGCGSLADLENKINIFKVGGPVGVF